MQVYGLHPTVICAGHVPCGYTSTLGAPLQRQLPLNAMSHNHLCGQVIDSHVWEGLGYQRQVRGQTVETTTVNSGLNTVPVGPYEATACSAILCVRGL